MLLSKNRVTGWGFRAQAKPHIHAKKKGSAKAAVARAPSSTMDFSSALALGIVSLLSQENRPAVPRPGVFAHDLTPEEYKSRLSPLHAQWVAYLDCDLVTQDDAVKALSTWEGWANEAGYFLDAIGQTDGDLAIVVRLHRQRQATEITCDQLRDEVLLRLHHVVARMIAASLHVPEDTIVLQIAGKKQEPLEFRQHVRSRVSSFLKNVCPHLPAIEKVWRQLPGPPARNPHWDFYPFSSCPRILFHPDVFRFFADIEANDGYREAFRKLTFTNLTGRSGEESFEDALAAFSRRVKEKERDWVRPIMVEATICRREDCDGSGAPNVTAGFATGERTWFAIGYNGADATLGTKRLGCWGCGVRGPERACSRCKVAKYCGEACQRTHWKDHKRICK